MKVAKTALQVLGILLLIPAVSMTTLRFENRNADGPSILFPGGEMTSGELHTGPDPDWSFTDEIATIDLQLNSPMASRRIYILESEGKIYIVSGYMKSFLGKIWKEWAFEAAAGNDKGVMRVNGIRYPRKLVRIEQGDVLNGVAAKLLTKYSGISAPASAQAIQDMRSTIESGDTWAFELAPR